MTTEALMLIGVVMLLGVLLASAIAVRRPAGNAVVRTTAGRWMQRSALAMLALYVLGLVSMGIGEMAGEIAGGEGHLVPAAAAAFLAVLGWRRPDAAGTVLLILGALIAAYFLGMSLRFGWPAEWVRVLPRLLVGAGPFLIPGLLLKLATGTGRRGAIPA